MKIECFTKSITNDFILIIKVILILAGIIIGFGIISTMISFIPPSMLVLSVPIGCLLLVDGVIIFASLIAIEDIKTNVGNNIAFTIGLIGLISVIIGLICTKSADLVPYTDLCKLIGVINFIVLIIIVPIIRAYCKCKEE